MSLVVYFSIWDDMAHNPNINRREHFCPCGCNANCQYTSVSSEPATHERPNSEAAWNNWWTCKDSWEEPNLSRAFPGLVWTAIEQVKLFTTLNRRVERTLVRRMLPQYKKKYSTLSSWVFGAPSLGNLGSVYFKWCSLSGGETEDTTCWFLLTKQAEGCIYESNMEDLYAKIVNNANTLVANKVG